MASPFGVSAGDIIAAIGVVRDLIKALRASGGASQEFTGLMLELYSLETALLDVKALHLATEQERHQTALRQAATQCQRTVDRFLRGLRKYQPYLGNPNGSHGWKDVIRKIQWQMCKQDELVKFRAEVGSHAHSINMLMLSIQMCVRIYPYRSSI